MVACGVHVMSTEAKYVLRWEFQVRHNTTAPVRHISPPSSYPIYHFSFNLLTTLSSNMLSRSASQRGTKLPHLSRRASEFEQPSPAPADALKPDEEAIDDVFAKVKETGTLEGAARRLAELAAAEADSGVASPLMARRQSQAWEDDPEEAAYFAAQRRGGYEEEGDEEEEAEYIEHMNEVIDGLWIGDLVSAMDADGMRERGIVSSPAQENRHWIVEGGRVKADSSPT